MMHAQAQIMFYPHPVVVKLRDVPTKLPDPHVWYHILNIISKQVVLENAIGRRARQLWSRNRWTCQTGCGPSQHVATPYSDYLPRTAVGPLPLLERLLWNISFGTSPLTPAFSTASFLRCHLSLQGQRHRCGRCGHGRTSFLAIVLSVLNPFSI